jgi:inositol phosphorylceramide synthase catalytic subunit
MKLLSWSERIDAFRRAHWFYNRVAPALSAAYLAALWALGGLKAEHWVLAGAVLGLSFWNDWTRRWGKVVFPVLLYAGVYDSMRFYADFIRSPVIHVREPHALDAALFGLRLGDKIVPPPEFLQAHTHPALDFVTGLAYFVLFFVGESIALTIYFFATGREQRALRFIWVFVAANFIGFSLYYIYPAAPPWYVAQYGFEVDLTARASAAG